jgi:deoxycytidylate deaminase
LTEREGPELVFALIGATGTDLGDVSRSLIHALDRHDYKAVSIRLSDLITRYALDDAPLAKFEDDRVEQAMARGTALRERFGHGDGVARLAIAEIATERAKITGDKETPAPRTAYILRGLKHPSEVKTLRIIYKDSAHVISVYEPKSVRLQRVFEKIKKSRRPKLARPTDADASDWKNRAEQLIDRDEDERRRPLGQHLQNTFHLADLFVVKGLKTKPLMEQLERYTGLLFGARFVTPTLDEVGSFQAQAAGYRSADLSRQVGAVITLPDGPQITSGYNEVPAAGGGHFVEDFQTSDCDHRDYTSEMDASAAAKHEIIEEIFDTLRSAQWLTPDLCELNARELTNRALIAPIVEKDGDNPILADAHVNDLLEFGRCVHAEMSALMEAARKGRAVEGATLYCTTFPCHMCARHIIAAGISRVVYIEPYQKSQAKVLYPDSVSVDGADGCDPKSVRFEPFFGVAPRRFLRMFQMLQRKDKATGYAVAADYREREPRDFAVFPVYRDTETWYTKTVSDLIRKSEGHDEQEGGRQ